MEATSSKAIAALSLFITLAVAGIVEVAAMGVAWPLRLASILAVGLATAGVCHTAVAAPLLHRIRTERIARLRISDELTRARAQWDLTRAAGRAIGVAADEVQALTAVTRAAAAMWPQRTIELLLCSDHDGHGTWITSLDEHGLVPPVELGGDGRCLALMAGRPALAVTTARLDVCPHLAGGDEVSTVCIAVTSSAGPVAVLTCVGAPGDLPTLDEVDDLESLARDVGRRLDELAPTAADGDEVADIVDPLTGLPNHRTAHREMRRLIGGFVPFSVAICDLDQFAEYNDRYGYETGNRALALFAGALRSTLRPGDVMCRYGDDAFVVLFPKCSSLNAQAAMERVREAMVLDASGAEISPFTCSVGVADSNQGESIEELLDTADLALVAAKQEGGNRVRLALFDSAG